MSDKIKKGLECCSLPYKCDKCPYFGMPCESDDLSADALALIKQLERERDAAVAEIKRANRCSSCKHYASNKCDGWSRCGYNLPNWEWRGVLEVEDENA